MDLLPFIKVLKEEQERIDAAIAVLESMIVRGEAAPPTKKGRGRKSMPEAEKAEVSRRMKQYWKLRRQQKKGR